MTMLDISLSVFRLYGAPFLLAKPREGGGVTLFLQDGAEEFPVSGELTVHMPNLSHDALAKAVSAFNREIQDAFISSGT